MNRLVVVSSLLGLLVGCGGAKPEAEASDKPAKAAAPKSNWEPAPLPDEGPIKILGLTGPDDKPWDDMNYD